MDNKYEELLNQANTARRVAMVLAENIYAYIGGVITQDELKNIVKLLLRKDKVDLLEHRYILKDFVDDIYEDINSDSYDDCEELIIIDGADKDE